MIADEAWPPGSGEMAGRIRAHDWAGTSLGPIESWSPRLRGLVELVLASPQACAVLCAPDRLMIYNDATIQSFGSKHPGALGRPSRETFPEAAGALTPLYDRAFAGEAVVARALPLDMQGPSTPVADLYDFHLTPVREEDGQVAYVHTLGVDVGPQRRAEAERAKAEAVVAESEARYRALFERMAEGFAVMKAVRDEAGRITDFRHLESNPASERVTGVSSEMVMGRLIAEVLPPEDARYWIDAYAQVLTTEEPARVEHFVEALDRWLRVNIAPFGGDCVAAFYEDVTARKRAEAAQRASEARQAFLLRLGDVLRTLSDPVAIQDAAMRLLGEELGLARAYYFQVERENGGWVHVIDSAFQRDPGGPSMIGRHGLSHFGDWMFEGFERGEVVAVADVAALSTLAPEELASYQALGVTAFINVPLLRDGTYSAGIGAHDTGTHDWTEDEVALIREVAARTWATAERARAEAALRDGAERQAFLLRLSDALRAEPDEDAVAMRAVGMLADHMGLDRCYVAFYRPEHDEAAFPYQVGNDAVPLLPATLRLSDFPEAYEQVLHRTFVAHDDFARRELSDAERASREALGVGAMLGSTLRRGEGNPLASLMAVSSRARRWTPGEIALVEEAAERTWAVMERARAEASLRASEERHRTLFETMGQGYADLELVRDADGRAVDQRYLELNPAYERLIGTAVAEAKGRRASEVMPGLEPWWTEAFDRVARTGSPERIEHKVASLGRWYEVHAYPRGDDRLTVLYEDVTARKQAEASLRESEAGQAFLLRLSDTLRGETDERRIEQVALEMLAEHLSADRAYITTSDYDKGETTVPAEVRRGELPPLVGIFRHSDFPESSHAVNEGTMVTHDVGTDPGLSEINRRSYGALRIGAVVGVGLRKGVSDIFWTLAVAMTNPRTWTPDEVLLLEDVAERVLSALARARAEVALRESEARLAAAFESVPVGVAVIDASGVAVVANPDYQRFLPTGLMPSRDPDRIGRWRGWDAEGRLLEPRDFPGARALRGERVVPGQEMLYTDDGGREVWTSVAAVPIRDGTKQVTGMISVISDIDTAKRSGDALRESEEALAADLANAERLRSLAERLVSEESSEAIYDEVLTATVAIAQADAGTIQIYDPAKKALELIASRNFSRAIIDHFHLVDAGSRSACGVALRTGERAFVDFPDEVADLGCQLLIGEDIQSAMALPLISRTGAPLGMLNAHWRTARHRPSDGELRFLDLLARQAADLIEQGRAQTALREGEERLRAFGEASTDVLWIRDADTLDWTYLSPAFEQVYGLSREEALAGDTWRNWLELVVPEDREHARAMIGQAVAGERVVFEYRIRRPSDGAVRTLRNTDFPIRDADGFVTRVGGVGHDATAEKQAQAAVAASEERLRVLTEGIPQLVWTAVDHGQWTWASPQWTAFTGQAEEDSHGWGWLDALHPDDRAGAREAWERSKATGTFEAEYRLLEAATGEHRWFQTRATAVHDEAGQLVEWLGTSTDVQDLRESEERQGVLVAELQHRTRNLMTVVLSVLGRTQRGSPDKEDLAASLRSRYGALSRVNSLLSRLNEGDRVAFDHLIRTELEAMGAVDGAGQGERVTLDGPSGVRLRSATVQTFALALHELATNAVKYGALAEAQPRGHLAVRWRRRQVDGESWLHVEWVEAGIVVADPAAAPQGTGFGRELIERALPHQLKATTTYVLAQDGVRCTIDLPLSLKEAVDA